MDEGWTDGRIELLRQLWDAGYSARQIAKELGGGINRCAVLGKVWRLKLERRRPPRVVRPIKPPPLGRLLVFRRKYVFSPRPMQLPSAPSPPRMRQLKLMELERHHCRWPVGNPSQPDFFFCAADADADGVYCPYHMRAAYVRSAR